MIVSASPRAEYDQSNERAFRDAVMREDRENLKRAQDIELVNGARIILTSPDGSQFSLEVANDGTLSATPV